MTTDMIATSPTHPVPRNSSIVVTQVGNNTYPMRSVAHCHTCQHPDRNLVETEIAKGRPYTAILRSIPEDARDRLSVASMRNHFNSGHMPVALSQNRAIVEERARTVGRAIEDNVDSLVDHVVIARTVVQRGYERMVLGEIEPDVKDTIAAAKFMADIEASAAEVMDLAVLESVFQAYMDAVRPELTPEAMKRFGNRLDRNPILANLRAKMTTQPTEIIEHEAIEEAEG